MWDLKKIREQKKYVEERLKTCKYKKEQEKLEMSLLCYVYMLVSSGSIRNTRFYNFMDKISGNRFSLQREQKYAKLENKLVFGEAPYVDSEYINFLIQLILNIVNNSQVEIKKFDKSDFDRIEFSSNELKEISRDFYRQLGDDEIYAMAQKLLDDPEAINFTDNIRRGYSDYGGITIYDFIFNKAYCNIHNQHNYFNLQSTNHEVMHGIDFYFHPKLESENYHGFQEIPTYTIDYLFLEYLEKKGYNLEEIEKLKLQKDYYIYYLAKDVLTDLRLEIKQFLKRLDSGEDLSEEIKKILTPDLLTKLFEIESGIVASGIYNQILQDRQHGIDNLKKIMRFGLPRKKIPDFSNLGLSNENLIYLATQIGTFSKTETKKNK